MTEWRTPEETPSQKCIRRSTFGRPLFGPQWSRMRRLETSTMSRRWYRSAKRPTGSSTTQRILLLKRFSSRWLRKNTSRIKSFLESWLPKILLAKFHQCMSASRIMREVLSGTNGIKSFSKLETLKMMDKPRLCNSIKITNLLFLSRMFIQTSKRKKFSPKKLWKISERKSMRMAGCRTTISTHLKVFWIRSKLT